MPLQELGLWQVVLGGNNHSNSHKRVLYLERIYKLGYSLLNRGSEKWKKQKYLQKLGIRQITLDEFNHSGTSERAINLENSRKLRCYLSLKRGLLNNFIRKIKVGY